jgi:hypothetical protein
MFECGDYPDDGVPCVYSLIDPNGVVVYVGQSIAVRSRLYTHVSSGITFADFNVTVVEESEMNDQEALLIVKHNSRFNQTIPKNTRYINRSTAKSNIALHAIRLVNRLPAALHREPKYKGGKTFSYVSKKDQDKILSQLDDLFCDFENEHFALCDAHYRVTISNKDVLIDGVTVSSTEHQTLASRLRKKIVAYLLENSDRTVSAKEIVGLFWANIEA